jgi:hypothetical protein
VTKTLKGMPIQAAEALMIVGSKPETPTAIAERTGRDLDTLLPWLCWLVDNYHLWGCIDPDTHEPLYFWKPKKDVDIQSDQ